jgi:enoyl-CoA hydratase
MADRFVEIEVENYIATLSLANNKSLNALTVDFAAEITEAVKALDARDDVRVIILKSNARIFCAGLDLKGLMALGILGCGVKTAYYFQDKLQVLFDCCNILEICRKPIIAAVHGMCIGGGLDIISACDIRLCTEDASFCLKEAAIGMVADMGVLQRLPHIIGQGFTREMAYTARLYSSREAERMGLVNAVYPDQETLLAEAKKLAGQITENGPLGVMATKEVLNYSRTASIEEGMHMGIQKNALFMSSKDIQEAITAFMQKRKPNFKGE